MSLFPFDNSYARLPERFYAALPPEPVSKPGLIKLNDGLAEDLGLDTAALKSDDGLAVLAGNAVPENAQPLAMAYAGQQFGNWVPQLGDGRAVLLGEVLGKDGLRYDIQLKGSGPTPFSRRGDGRAWLGPVMREYIVSEAMAALGIATTRALAAVTTGDPVYREAVLPGAVLTRVSRGHIRVGTFQYFAARRDQEAVKTLADYSIDRLYPHLRHIHTDSSVELYAAFLGEVIAAHAKLVAQWMGVGFIHGVMNTDNVSIAGETIDYGPCAFMDAYHPDKVFSSIDEMGRYAFSNQPRIAHWNLVQFAQCLMPLFGDEEEVMLAVAQEQVDRFPQEFERQSRKVMNVKIGLETVEDDDGQLVQDLLDLMAQSHADFTQVFSALTRDPASVAEYISDRPTIDAWLSRWRDRVEREADGLEGARVTMGKANPIFTPRNHRIDQAIKAGLQGDYAPFERLLTALAKPFDAQPDAMDLADPPQDDEQVRYTFCGT